MSTPVFPTCDAIRAYLLSGYDRFAGLPAGWNTPRIRIGPGSAVLDAVHLVRRKVEARSCLERDGAPADVRGSLARDDVSHLVVAVAVEGRLARLDDAHELRHVEAAGVLVHEVPEGPLARGVELGLVGEANRHLALAARRLPVLRARTERTCRVLLTRVLDRIGLAGRDEHAHFRLEACVSPSRWSCPRPATT